MITSLNATANERRVLLIRWWIPFILAAISIAYILNTYPMMRPGFDVWWHLGVINNPRILDPTSVPPPRIYWHEFWHFTLTQLNVTDLFERALIIHRTQFLLMFGLLTASGYLILSSVMVEHETIRPQLLSFSLLSACLWCVMTGTRSVARDQGPGSDVTQGWILWYTVNYQISLGFALLAIASTLFAVTTRTRRIRFLAVCLCITCLLMTFLSHMAEIAYYLFSVSLMLLFFTWRRSLLFMAVGLVPAIFFVLLVFKYSFVRPQILDFLSGMSAFDFLQSAAVNGSKLRNATRVNTGWTIIHLFSALSIVFGAFASWVVSSRRGPTLRLRPTLFVLSTAVFPLALFSDIGVGLYSLATYGGIAYRFAYSSLLFVGIPLGALTLSSILLPKRLAIGQIAVGILICLTVTFGAFALERYSNAPPSAYLFFRSLTDSLDRKKSYFISNGEDRKAIAKLSEFARSRNQSTIACPGAFSSYYLFFVSQYKNVYLAYQRDDISGAFVRPGEHGEKPFICNYLDINYSNQLRSLLRRWFSVRL